MSKFWEFRLQKKLLFAAGVIFPAGYTIVNLEAPEDQPRRQGAYPQSFQEYFDRLCNDIVTLKTVPMNKSPHSGYDRIVYGEDNEGQVSLKLQVTTTKLMLNLCGRSQRSCSCNTVGQKLFKEMHISMRCASIIHSKPTYDHCMNASIRGFAGV